MKRLLIAITYLLLINYKLLATPAPPDISSTEAVLKAEEIFSAHIRFKDFSPEITKRTLSNFIEELDPLKTYFLFDEVDPYINPSPEFLQTVVKDYHAHRFTAFEKIYDIFLANIERRNSLEGKIQNVNLPHGIKVKEIQTSDFAKTEEALSKKLLMIRALQVESAEKLATKEQYDLFLQRVVKRRINHEKEFIGDSKIHQKHQVLTFFLKSLSSALDTHTMYFTPSEAKQFLIQVQQRLFGIGAQLRDDLNGFTVVHIVEGGPAARNGELKVGDKIIAVDREPIVGLDIGEAVEHIRGPEGSKAILTILRESTHGTEQFDIVIIRDEVILTDTRYGSNTVPFGDGVIGHLSLHSFYQDPNNSSTSDLKKTIEEMKQKHQLLGIILDLRHNSGGLLPQAVGVAGLFINKGVVASIKDYDGRHQRLRNLSDDFVWDGPLIVLIDRASASASEIVALALADYGRALIVGDDTSYGKGSYQTFTLESSNPDKINPKGEYKVTRGTYYTVGGNTPQLVGVRSQIEIPGVLSQAKIGEKYNKFPLDNDQIDPLFIDDLSDVHPLYRTRLKKILTKSSQRKMNDLQTLIPLLAQHSQERIASNQNYQNLLNEIKNADTYELDLDKIGQNDLQLEETINTMKELILMTTSR